MSEATLQYVICTTWWFLSLSDDHHITGCVMLWIYTARCSGNMAASTLHILLFPRGRSSNWWKQELLGNTHIQFFVSLICEFEVIVLWLCPVLYISEIGMIHDFSPSQLSGDVGSLHKLSTISVPGWEKNEAALYYIISSSNQDMWKI